MAEAAKKLPEWATKLPEYVGCKTVRAAQIVHAELNTYKPMDDPDHPGVVHVHFKIRTDDGGTLSLPPLDDLIVARGMPNNGDWLMVYPDGYVSISPAHAFAAYVRKDSMAIEGSPTMSDYYPKERFRPIRSENWPPRTSALFQAVGGVRGFVGITGEVNGHGIEQWSFVHSLHQTGMPNVADLQRVSFHGPAAADSLCDYIEWQYEDVLGEGAAFPRVKPGSTGGQASAAAQEAADKVSVSFHDLQEPTAPRLGAVALFTEFTISTPQGPGFPHSMPGKRITWHFVAGATDADGNEAPLAMDVRISANVDPAADYSWCEANRGYPVSIQVHTVNPGKFTAYLDHATKAVQEQQRIMESQRQRMHPEPQSRN